MKIAFEAKRVFHNKTGLGNYSRDLIRILADFFPDNDFLLYNPKPNNEILFKNTFTNVFEKRPATPFYQKFYNLWRQKGIVKDLKKDGIELFHGLSGELPTGLRQNNIKSVVTIHDLIFVRYPELYSFFDRKIHCYKFKKAAKNADLIIAISEQTKRDIESFLKVPSEKIQVVYQGCQNVFKNEYSETEKQKVRQKFHLPNEFILNVGTLEERKNALTLVKAIKDIDTQLILVGKETKYTEQIHQYIKENGIEGKVIFLKGLSSEELAITYQLATVFVYPSIFEGFGIPIIEALFSKTPVITTNSGVFPEAGGPNSMYIDPMNEQEIKSKIDFLLQNEAVRHDMAQKGLEYASKFKDDVIAKQIMDCYTSLI